MSKLQSHQPYQPSKQGQVEGHPKQTPVIASRFQSRKEYDKHKILKKKVEKAEVQNAVILKKKQTDFLCIKYYHVNVQCISIVNTKYQTITEINMGGVEFLLQALSINNM